MQDSVLDSFVAYVTFICCKFNIHLWLLKHLFVAYATFIKPFFCIGAALVTDKLSDQFICPFEKSPGKESE